MGSIIREDPKRVLVLGVAEGLSARGTKKDILIYRGFLTPGFAWGVSVGEQAIPSVSVERVSKAKELPTSGPFPAFLEYRGKPEGGGRLKEGVSHFC